MDESTKQCPECGAEYYAHIEVCGSCDVKLLSSQDISEGRINPTSISALVCIMEGPIDRLKEISHGLDLAGFESRILNAKSEDDGDCCATGCGSDTFGIYLSQSVAEKAASVARDLQNRMYPEIAEMEDQISQGNCPACGHSIEFALKECPDCGLYIGA